MDNPEYSLKPVTAPSNEMAPPRPEKQADSAAIKDKDIESNASDSPLGVDYFGINYWPEIILSPDLDYYKTVEKVLFIEDFIKDRIKDNGLKQDKTSFQKVLKSMEDELGMSPEHESHLRVDKIFNLLRLMKSTSYDKEKKRIINLLKSNK